MSEPSDQIRIQIHPEPTREEMAAISATVVVLTIWQQNDNREGNQALDGGQSRWVRTARREVMRPFERD